MADQILRNQLLRGRLLVKVVPKRYTGRENMYWS